MRQYKTVILTILILLVANAPLLEGARGGGGRGGGARTGGGRQASFSRAPSMSRAVPNRPQTQSASTKQFQQRPISREQGQQFLHQTAPQRVNQGSLGQQRQLPQSSLGNQQQIANRVRDQVRQNRPDQSSWFNNQFFHSHRYQPYYANRNVNWWRAANWTAANNWLSWGWGAPIYYDDQGMPVTYTDSGYPAGYSQQTQTLPPQPPSSSINQSLATAESAQDDWMSLGVFAAGRTAEQAALSNMVVQLALNKQGDIAGTYYNTATDKTYPLAGIVDKKTQRAVWVLSENSASPLMTTGLYNLTQDIAVVQIYFPDNVTKQTWMLVRLNQ